MSHSIPQLIANYITTVIVTIMLCIYDWRMALAMFCVLPISFSILFLGRKLQDKWATDTLLQNLECLTKCRSI